MKLFVVRGRDQALALDAALNNKRVGCDAVDDAIENLKQFLRSKLQPDDFAQLESLVAQIGNTGSEVVDPQGAKTGHEYIEGEDNDLAESDLTGATKRVPGGLGLPGKEIASDSRRKGYADRFPDAGRGVAAGSSTVKWGYVK
jgi:hypothetical protein